MEVMPDRVEISEILHEMSVIRDNNWAGNFPFAAERFGFILPFVWRMEAEVLVDIGVGHGPSFYALGCACKPGARLIGIDPGKIDSQGRYAGGLEQAAVMMLGRLMQKRYRPTLLIMTSKEACGRVISDLGDRKIDVLHIDGDHTYEACKLDWNLYSPLMNSGGLVIFHDVAAKQWKDGAGQVWREVSSGFEETYCGVNTGIIRMP